MTILKTLDDITLCASCDPSLKPHLEWLMCKLADIHLNQCRFSDGSVVRFGFTHFSMHQSSPGLLVVHEPNFSENPFNSTRTNISTSLIILIEQKEILLKLKVDGIETLFADKIILSKAALEETRVYLERKAAPTGDSGWYIGPIDRNAENTTGFEAFYAYQLIKLRPELLQVLALPVGYLVVFNGNIIESIVNSNDEECWARNSGTDGGSF